LAKFHLKLVSDAMTRSSANPGPYRVDSAETTFLPLKINSEVPITDLHPKMNIAKYMIKL